VLGERMERTKTCPEGVGELGRWPLIRIHSPI
jgi:hypothetical protein